MGNGHHIIERGWWGGIVGVKINLGCGASTLNNLLEAGINRNKFDWTNEDWEAMPGSNPPCFVGPVGVSAPLGGREAVALDEVLVVAMPGWFMTILPPEGKVRKHLSKKPTK